MTKLEVLFSPAEFSNLAARDLSQTVCVVFDVLRATSSMVTALANGAIEIIPVATIEEALALRANHSDLLLAGERHGLRIGRELTGGIDFDLGNSPREFVAGQVARRRIAMTTTNGTRALRACATASMTWVGAFLNLSTLARFIQNALPADLLLVCSGTYEEASYEDTLAAGALCERLWKEYADGHVADSATIARQIFLAARSDLPRAMNMARNGRRLLNHPDLSADVPTCLEIDRFNVAPRLYSDGAIRL